MTSGRYEILLERALDNNRPRLWSTLGLSRVGETPTDDFCLAFGRDCDRNAALDWLEALPPDSAADLLERLDAGWRNGQP